MCLFFFFKPKAAYDLRISDWSSDGCSSDLSPEVLLVRDRMERSGVDFCLDVHGNEGLPYVFIAGADAIPSATDRQIRLREAFEAALQRANPRSDERRVGKECVRTCRYRG